MATETFVSQINGKNIYAARAIATTKGVNIDSKLEELEQSIAAVGSYEVVPLTSGANPVPDVADPSTKVIYLTKDSSSTATDPYTEWIWIAGSPSGSWEIIGETTIDLSGYKTKQTAVSVTGGTLKGVASFSQNENGDCTLTLNDIQDGTTSQKGVVQLQGSIGATETTDTKAATPKAVRDAINALDASVASAGASGVTPNFGLTVTEADGKITGVTVDSDNTENKNNKVTSWSSTVTDTNYPSEKLVKNSLDNKADKVSGATNGNFAGLDANGNLTDSGKKAADFATSAQGAKADSAIQGVKSNGTALTPDANKIIDIPVATSSVYGVVTIGTVDL